MDEPYYRLSHADFTIWLHNFRTEFEADPTVLGFTSAEATELKNDDIGFKTLLDERAALEAQLAAKVAEVDNKREEIEDDLGYYSPVIKKNKNIPDQKKLTLGLKLDDDVDSNPTPNQPIDLTVVGSSNGTNHLKCKRNENTRGTIFIWEAKIGDGEFNQIGASRAVTFEHRSQKPGVKISYRVKATRNGLESDYSEEAILYDN